VSQQTIIEQAIEQHCHSGAQKAAATKVVDELLASFQQVEHVPDVVIGDGLQPQAQAVVMVASGDEPSRQERESLWPLLDSAVQRFGSVEIVTFGGRGTERAAHEWARRNGAPVREFATLWNLPVGGGATVPNTRALMERNAAIGHYVHKAPVPIALLHGADGSSSARRAQDVFRTATRAGAFHSGRPVPAVDLQPEETSEPVDVAGSPDVPPVAA
jgi:hypothetical protein